MFRLLGDRQEIPALVLSLAAGAAIGAAATYIMVRKWSPMESSESWGSETTPEEVVGENTSFSGLTRLKRRSRCSTPRSLSTSSVNETVERVAAFWQARTLDHANAQWLRRLSKTKGKVGIDIGGTLAKVVVAKQCLPSQQETCHHQQQQQQEEQEEEGDYSPEESEDEEEDDDEDPLVLQTSELSRLLKRRPRIRRSSFLQPSTSALSKADSMGSMLSRNGSSDFGSPLLRQSTSLEAKGPVRKLGEEQQDNRPKVDKVFGRRGTRHKDMSFQVKVADTKYRVSFLSGATHLMERASVRVKDLIDQEERNNHQRELKAQAVSPPADKEGKRPVCTQSSEVGNGGAVCSNGVKKTKENGSEAEERACENGEGNVKESGGGPCTSSPPPPPLRQIVAAGGGAHKFEEMFRNLLNIRLLVMKEMQSVVEGLMFLDEHRPEGELFAVDHDTGKELPREWPAAMLPCLIVNMGSGVSVIRIEDNSQSTFTPSPENQYGAHLQNAACRGRVRYTRVGGTSCGGATFVGLCKLLTSARSFDEALELAEQGDATHVDKLVGDIYGEEGCSDLGMAATLTAANFGKFTLDGTLNDSLSHISSEFDLARSALQMVIQASSVLVRAFMLERVFFVGGFLEDNPLARKLLSKTMQGLGGEAWFLRHSDFLGALGSLGQCLMKAHHVSSDTHDYQIC